MKEIIEDCKQRYKARRICKGAVMLVTFAAAIWNMIAGQWISATLLLLSFFLSFDAMTAVIDAEEWMNIADDCMERLNHTEQRTE